MKDPFQIIRSRYVTEKSTMLEQLQSSESNRCIAKCQSPKYVFLVDPRANKHEIAKAIEQIYAEQKIKVVKVNTLNVKRKPKKRGRGRPGKTAALKKAVVTMEQGDSIDNV